MARNIALSLLANVQNHELMRTLGGFSVEVCEAAAMAHDIGHPPFGHIGEQSLDDLARGVLELPDGFEGNAQTLRSISMGRTRSTQYEGLDLTCAVIAATAKYPWQRVPYAQNEHDKKLETDPDYRRKWKKFSAYRSEASMLADVRAFLPDAIGKEIQTLESSVMDVADDITYAIHDLEDFYLAGFVDTLVVLADLTDARKAIEEGKDSDSAFFHLTDRLSHDYPEYFNRGIYEKQLLEVEAWIRTFFTHQSRRGHLYDEDEPRARSAASNKIGDLIRSVELHENVFWVGGPHIGLPKPEWHQVQILKEITKAYVINAAEVALLQIGQRKILEDLLRMLMDWAERDPHRLPTRLRAELAIGKSLELNKEKIGYGSGLYVDRGDHRRAYLDFICTLSDAQCISLHAKLSGRQLHRAGRGFDF